MIWEQALKLIVSNVRTRGEMEHDELVDVLMKEIKGKKGLKRTVERCLKTLVEAGILVKEERGVYKWFESVEMFATAEKYEAALEHSKNLVAGFISLSHNYGGTLEEYVPPSILREYVGEDKHDIISSNLRFSSGYMMQTKPYAISHLQAYLMEKKKVDEAVSLMAERAGKEKLLKEEAKRMIRERFDEGKVPEDLLENPVILVSVEIEGKLRGYKSEELDKQIDTSSSDYDYLLGRGISAKGYGEEVRSFLKELRNDEKLRTTCDEKIVAESKYYDAKKLADEVLSKVVLKIASGEPLKGKCEICLGLTTLMK